MMCCPIDWSAANDKGKCDHAENERGGKPKTEIESAAELSYEHVHCTFDDHGYSLKRW